MMEPYLNELLQKRIPLTKDISDKQSPNRFIRSEQFITDGRKSHIITLSGTYYDMGYLLGREYAKQLVDEVTSTYFSVKRKVIIYLKKQREVFNQELDEAVHKFLPLLPTECIMEFAGIYAGCREAGYPFLEPMILEKFLTLIELGEQECTLFAAQPPYTRGHTYQIRDLDYYPNMNMNYIPVLLVRIPQDNQGKPVGNSYASIDFMCNITGGVTTGINEHGVAFSQSRGPFYRRFSNSGLPIKNLIQLVLAYTQTAKEATDLIRMNHPATSHFVIISDPLQKKDSLQLLFMGPGFVHAYSDDESPDLNLVLYDDPKYLFYQPIKGAVYWTDMVGRKVNGVPEEFLMHDFYNVLQSKSESFDKDTGLEVAKTVGNDDTFISALYDTTLMEAWIGYSMRDKPAHTNNYTHFNLNKYFAYKNEIR